MATPYSIQQEIFNLINNIRIKEGLTPLKFNPLLNDLAMQKNKDMVDNDYFKHKNKENKNIWDYFDKETYPYASVGENLGLEFSNAQEIVDALMASPTHRENILGEDYEDVGYSVLPKNGKYTLTQIFGAINKEKANTKQYVYNPTTKDYAERTTGTLQDWANKGYQPISENDYNELSNNTNTSEDSINQETNQNVSDTTNQNTPNQNTPPETIERIGEERVKQLFRIHLGRDDAHWDTPEGQRELDIYKDHTDETRLINDLNITKQNIAEQNKIKVEEDQKKIDQDQAIAEETKIKNEEIINADPSTREAIFKDDGQQVIKFAEDPDGDGPQSASTLFIIDKNKKTMRPVMSEEAFNNNFETSLADITSQGRIKTISLDDLESNGMFAGYNKLPNEYGLKEDRVLKPYEPTVDITKAENRYGKPVDIKATEKGLEMISLFFKWLKSSGDSGISDEKIDEMAASDEYTAFYGNATIFGGYNMDDIARDMKRLQLIDEGRDEFAGMVIISPDIPASKYTTTSEYKNIRNNEALSPPATIGNLDVGLLENPVFNLDQEVYDALVEPIDFTTPAGREEMDKIKSSYYDLLLNQVSATTEQARTIANNNYTEFKEKMKDDFDMTLSDNSNEAWGQLSNLGTSMSKRGLAGSGMEREAREKYLSSLRKSEGRLEDAKLDAEEEAERKHLLEYGTAKEIAALSPEKKQKYGFIPDEDALKWFSKENLKKEHPELTDEQIDLYRKSMFDITTDADGNEQLLFKSELDQKKFKDMYGERYGLGVPEGGIIPAKEEYQQGEYYKNKDKEATEAMDRIKDKMSGKIDPKDSSHWDIAQPKEETVLPTEEKINEYQGVKMPTSFKTALNDVIANFSRYKGRNPSTKEDWTNVAFLMNLPPQDVESRLKGTIKDEQKDSDKVEDLLSKDPDSFDTYSKMPVLDIPFKEELNLSDKQKKDYQILASKPLEEWNPSDKKNWEHVTGNVNYGKRINITPENGALLSKSPKLPDQSTWGSEKTQLPDTPIYREPEKTNSKPSTGWYDQVTGKDTPIGVGTPRPKPKKTLFPNLADIAKKKKIDPKDSRYWSIAQ